MRWLLWKEYRQNWAILLVMALSWLLPFVIASGGTWYEHAHVTHANQWVFTWAEALCIASIWSVGCSCFMLVFLSGNVIAGERADRSAEFQAYLPIPRRKIVLVKILLLAGVAVAVWVPNLVLQWFTVDRAIFFDPGKELFHTIDPMIATVGVTACCVAWCFSAITRSVIVAAGVGLLSPTIIIISIAIWTHYTKLPDSTWSTIFTLICLTLAASGFIVGTWIAWRRVEP